MGIQGSHPRAAEKELQTISQSPQLLKLKGPRNLGQSFQTCPSQTSEMTGGPMGGKQMAERPSSDPVSPRTVSLFLFHTQYFCTRFL